MSNAPEDSKDYQIGYSKPPEQTRFKKGQSGNPKGRPKGSISFNKIVSKVSRTLIPVTVNGETRKMTAKEAFVYQTQASAIKGVPSAAKMYREMIHLAEAWEQQSESSGRADEKDVATLDAVQRRIERLGRQVADRDRSEE